MNIKDYFDESYYCIKILINATKIRDQIEKEQNALLEKANTDDEVQKKLEIYKRKLLHIYRIRNNAYAILLKKGFKCFQKEEDGNIIYYMNIEGDLYDCNKKVLKTIIKNIDEVIHVVDQKDIFEYELTTSMKPNSDIKPTLKKSKVDSLAKIEKIEVVREKEEESINENKKHTIKCPNCKSELEKGTTFCKFCGTKIKNNTKKKTNKVLTRKQFKEKSNEFKFSDEDIDSLFTIETQKVVEENIDDFEFDEFDINNNIEKSEESTDTIDATNIKEDLFADIPNNPKEPIEEIQDETEQNEANNIKNESLKLYNVLESEPIKHRNAIICDVYTLQLYDPKTPEEIEKIEKSKTKRQKITDIKNSNPKKETNRNIRTIKIYIYPLSVPESGTELATDVLVYITQDDKEGTYCSGDGTRSVNVATDIHEFIVRGDWNNNEFSSKVYLTGESSLQKCEVSREKEEIRPTQSIANNIGHPSILLTVEYTDGTESMKVHACPLKDKNDQDKLTKTLYLMENEKTKQRDLYISKDPNVINFQFEDEFYSVKSFWHKDEFKIKVEKFNM